jgi:hypothetical protein
VTNSGSVEQNPSHTHAKQNLVLSVAERVRASSQNDGTDERAWRAAEERSRRFLPLMSQASCAFDKYAISRPAAVLLGRGEMGPGLGLVTGL